MRGDFVSLAPHVNFYILVKTRDDKEDARTTGPAGEEAAEAEYNRSLVLLGKGRVILFGYSLPIMPK